MLQGLPDAETPENVLSLVETLQVQAVQSAEALGEKDSQLAAHSGEAKP